MRNEEKFLAIVLIAIVVGITISMFAPDRSAERIAACMTQPNMEYVHTRGCIRASE
jgi:hypothetical protein